MTSRDKRQTIKKMTRASVAKLCNTNIEPVSARRELSLGQWNPDIENSRLETAAQIRRIWTVINAVSSCGDRPSAEHGIRAERMRAEAGFHADQVRRHYNRLAACR